VSHFFRCFAFRFTFLALDSVHLPAGAPGNAFRGAFGHILRRIACVPRCRGARACETRQQCAYARLFEPIALGGPSGLRNAPRPFVIRASALNGRTYGPGEFFSLNVHVFDLHEPVLPYLERAFEQLAQEGIGAERGRAQLRDISEEKVSIPLEAPPSEGTQELSLRFVTPTELKSNGHVLRDAPFKAVLARVRDRVASVSALYGDGPLLMDFRGMGERAARVTTVSSTLRWETVQRTSSRTRQTHPLGGFVGEVHYHGAVGEFIPIVRAAIWTGIGRHTVWGNGEIEVL